MSRNFWDPGAGLHGLFELWSFSHVGRSSRAASAAAR